MKDRRAVRKPAVSAFGAACAAQTLILAAMLAAAPASAQEAAPPPPIDPNAAARSYILDQATRSSRGSRSLPTFRGPARDHEAGWSFSAGAGVMVRPAYIGAETYKVTPLPAIALSYSDWFFADPANGVGVRRTLLPGAVVSAGANYTFGRKEKDNARLIGLGDLDGGVTLFSALELRPLPGILQALSLQLGVQTPITGDIDGVEATADLAVAIPLGGNSFASISGGAIWADREMMQTLFGITPDQAARTVFPVYSPSSGLRAATAGVSALHPLSARWTALVSVDYERLVGDASRSPIIETKDQYRLAAGLVYRFGN